MLPLELLLLSVATIGARGDQLKLRPDSPRIQYQSSHGAPSNSGSTPSPNIFALFWRGTSVSIYASIIGSEKGISVTLDNQTQTLDFSLQPPNGGPIWSKAGLMEGDHQLLVSHSAHGPQPTAGQPAVPEPSLALDYILLEREAENDTEPQFEPARIGTTPTSVPPNAHLLDDTSNFVTTLGDWHTSHPPESPPGSYWFNSTAISTSSVGSSLIFSFTGSAVWSYGTRYPGGGSVDVTLDGARIDSFNASGYEQQYPLWSRQGLEPCTHTLVITTTNCPVSSCASSLCFNPCLSIDFFRFLDPVDSFADRPPPPPPPWGGPGDGPMGPDYQPSAIIAGTVGGVLLLLVIVVVFLAWHVLFVQPTAHKMTTGHSYIH